MERMPYCREYLSIDHPFCWDDPLKAFQGQSHRTSHRHSIHFSATGNEPEAKVLPSEGWLFVKLGTPGRGDIFVENLIVNRITHRVGEIFFRKSLLNSFSILH